MTRTTAGSKSASSDLVFSACWLFTAFVSVWDGYLTLSYRHQMQLAELNPVGKALIDLNGGDVHYLLLAKLAGTIMALTWLLVLYERNQQRGLLIAGPVAGFQLWLLLFLSFA